MHEYLFEAKLRLDATSACVQLNILLLSKHTNAQTTARFQKFSDGGCNEFHAFFDTLCVTTPWLFPAVGYRGLWHVSDIGSTRRTQSSAAGKGPHESTAAAYGTCTLGTVFSLQDLIFPAYGSPQTRRKLISFSERLRQGQSLHIQLDRQTGGNKVRWPRLRLFEGRERKGAKPVSSISSGPFCPHFYSKFYFLVLHVIFLSFVFMPREQTLVYTNQS